MAAPDERYRGERALAIARVCLAVLIATAGSLDRLVAPAPPPFVNSLLNAYVVAAAIILLIVLLKPMRWPLAPVIVQAIDVSVAAVVMLATDPRTPVWMMVVFALLAAAHRWGLRATILSAVLMSAPLAAHLMLPGITGHAIGIERLAGAVDARQFLVASALILLGGVALAYVTQAEQQFRAEAAALGAVVSRVQLRSGLKNTMGAVIDAVVRLADANRALVIVHEIGTGRVSLWEGGRLTGPAGRPVQVTEMEPHSLEHYMFAPDTAAWYAARPKSHREPLDISAVDREGSRSDNAPQRFPDPFLAAIGEFRSVMSVGFEMPGDLKGRLFLVDPHVICDRETTMALCQRMVQHLCPAVHSVYLLHRLGSRSAANERARVARELHDGIIQGVLSVEVQLHALSIPAAQTSPALASELSRLGNLLRGETARLRDMMQGLTPRELPPGQLMDTVAGIVQRFQFDTGINAQFITEHDIIDLSPRGCRELTRIVQEALVNVRKHSGARNVIVRLHAEDGVCQVSIDDDGRGFPYTGRRALDPEQAHLMLWSIRERVRVLGGQVAVESNPGRGARIEISFPVGSHAIL